jgi:hypothetical protein
VTATYRRIWPDEQTIKALAKASVVMEVGDLCYYDGTNVYPAGSQVDQLTEPLNQSLFASLFLGVANDSRLAAQTTDGYIVVITEGVFEYPCPATDWTIGDLIGASEAGSGTALLPQQVEKVTDPAAAIGICIEETPSGATTVKGFYQSKFLKSAAGVVSGLSVLGTFSAGSNVTDRVPISGFYKNPAVVAVAVPSITDPDIAKVDVSVAAAFSVSVAVGDFVIAAPMEALPTNCRLQGAWVSATDTVTITFGSEGGSVTGANKNFNFFLIKM